MFSIAAKRICCSSFARSSITLHSLPVTKPSTIHAVANNLSVFTRSSQSTTATKNVKSSAENITKEEIERLVAQHKVKMLSMPVRAEFLKKTPLTTKDLESIDIRVYHRKPEKISDYVAYFSVKFLRIFADLFFRKRYIHRAIVLETVAGVPGMVAGMLCHMKSLRRMQHDDGWVEKLLHEAENERMHLMIWMSVTKPTLFERFIVILTQGIFFNTYMLFYIFSPRTAHRFVGYLEEEAIVSYTAFAEEVLKGNIKNTPAPKIAIDYYNLDKDAKLIDVVYAVRADEAAHRDVNHNLTDKIDANRQKKKIDFFTCVPNIQIG